jgi:hypothetical protein
MKNFSRHKWLARNSVWIVRNIRRQDLWLFLMKSKTTNLIILTLMFCGGQLFAQDIEPFGGLSWTNGLWIRMQIVNAAMVKKTIYAEDRRAHEQDKLLISACHPPPFRYFPPRLNAACADVH